MEHIPPAFAPFLDRLHDLERDAERAGFFSFSDLLHETRAIAREHMEGFYMMPGHQQIQTKPSRRSH